MRGKRFSIPQMDEEKKDSTRIRFRRYQKRKVSSRPVWWLIFLLIAVILAIFYLRSRMEHEFLIFFEQ